MAIDATRTPRKAPARKAAPALAATPAPPRRKARPRPPEPAVIEGEVVGKADTVTAAPAPAQAAADTRKTVTLKGRAMAVKMPSAEQIDIVLDTYEELSNLSQAEVDALSEEDETKLNERARRLLRRARIGALIVLADEGDREWVTDEILRERITLNDVAALLPQAIKVLGTRKAPTTGPAPKARRR